jgi:hypothetical protein
MFASVGIKPGDLIACETDDIVRLSWNTDLAVTTAIWARGCSSTDTVHQQRIQRYQFLDYPKEPINAQIGH